MRGILRHFVQLVAWRTIPALVRCKKKLGQVVYNFCIYSWALTTVQTLDISRHVCKLCLMKYEPYQAQAFGSFTNLFTVHIFIAEAPQRDKTVYSSQICFFQVLIEIRLTAEISQGDPSRVPVSSISIQFRACGRTVGIPTRGRRGCPRCGVGLEELKQPKRRSPGRASWDWFEPTRIDHLLKIIWGEPQCGYAKIKTKKDYQATRSFPGIKATNYIFGRYAHKCLLKWETGSYMFILCWVSVQPNSF